MMSRYGIDHRQGAVSRKPSAVCTKATAKAGASDKSEATRFGGVFSQQVFPQQEKGFTLIELLVAVALLAIVAVLSWRGLDTVLQSRDRLVAESNGLRSLTLALSQMEDDLLQTWPVRNLNSSIRSIQVLRDAQSGNQSLLLVREVARRGRATRLQRVVYQIRNGELARGFSEVQRNADSNGNVGGAVQSLVWQPILQDVRSMRIRGWTPSTWLSGEQLTKVTTSNVPNPNAANNNFAINGTTPEEILENTRVTLTGIEVLIERTDGQRFLRVYSIRD